MKDYIIFHFLYFIDYQILINLLSDVLKDRFFLSFPTLPIHLPCFKFILMKKLFIFLIALLLPFFALEMSADEEKAIITIPIELGPEKNLTRSQGEEQIISYYNGMMTSIVTTFSLDLGEVTLTVTNCSTGEVWYDVYDSVNESQAIMPISGADGLYEIAYITESGDIYEGTFVLK